VRLIHAERTDPGLVRPNNQDAYAVETLDLPGGGALLVVADGMGGYDGGEVASRIAVDTVREKLLAGLAPGGAEQANLAASLHQAVLEANRGILRAQADRPELSSMGTTVTAILVQGGRLIGCHVGDSKAFLIGANGARQITSDHNVPGELMQCGHLTAEQAAVHPQRHILTRALGVEEELPVEQLDLTWHEGDLLLLCTDGLSNLVTLAEIQSLAAGSEPAELVERLVGLANNRGGHDNITVLAARWEG